MKNMLSSIRDHLFLIMCVTATISYPVNNHQLSTAEYMLYPFTHCTHAPINRNTHIRTLPPIHANPHAYGYQPYTHTNRYRIYAHIKSIL